MISKSIGLFFGSFNPIHNGHISLARYLHEHYQFDEIWLVVSPNNPLKDPHSLLDEQTRFRFASHASDTYSDWLKVSDIEFTMPKPSYTANTLRALSAAYPEIRFTLIIGSDNMQVFQKWREYEFILQHYAILVYPRKGDDLHQLSRLYPQMQIATDAPLFDISATQIRQMVANGEDIRPFVPKEVWQDVVSSLFDEHLEIVKSE